jgi:DNA-directed RNA polymerase subunit F
MAGKQITRNQHFVPSFYLKAFGDAQGNLHALDMNTGRVLKPRHHRAVGYRKFFYAVKTGVQDDISQGVETWFRSIEDQIAGRMQSIIENAMAGKLENSQIETLAYFMGFQWMRTDAFRKMINDLNESMSKQVMQIISGFPSFADDIRDMAAKEGRQATEAEIEQHRQVFEQGRYNLTFDNTQHLLFMTPKRLEGFHNLLGAQQWTIVKAGGTRRFVTSDNPVAVGLPKASGIYGLSFLERTHCLALTPELLIEASEPDPYPDPPIRPADTACYRTADDTEVLMYNILQVRRAGRFLYSQSPNELRAILREIDKAGHAMRMYIDRFEQQAIADGARRKAKPESQA